MFWIVLAVAAAALALAALFEGPLRCAEDPYAPEYGRSPGEGAPGLADRG